MARWITADMYNKKLKQYKEKQDDILESMKEHSEADQELYITANTVLNLAKRALEIFESSEPQGKKHFLSYSLRNCLLNGKTLEFALRNPFDTIVSARGYTLRGERADSNR